MISNWKEINICKNIMTIDPAIKGNTRIKINGNDFCEINGSFNDQINNIKLIIDMFSITQLRIDTNGLGHSFYDTLKEVYNPSEVFIPDFHSLSPLGFPDETLSVKYVGDEK